MCGVGQLSKVYIPCEKVPTRQPLTLSRPVHFEFSWNPTKIPMRRQVGVLGHFKPSWSSVGFCLFVWARVSLLSMKI